MPLWTVGLAWSNGVILRRLLDAESDATRGVEHVSEGSRSASVGRPASNEALPQSGQRFPGRRHDTNGFVHRWGDRIGDRRRLLCCGGAWLCDVVGGG